MFKKTKLFVEATADSGGGVTPTGKYQLLDRVKDDNNNEIGTVTGFHTDANNVKYAVVCLDAQYRQSGAQYLSADVAITGLATLQDQTLWENTDTATSNCDKILAFIDGTEYTSSAVTHCRSKSFVIEGTTYYGQLPTIVELTDIFMNRTAINTKDTSASQYSSFVVPSATHAWSSSQPTGASNGLYLRRDGTVTVITKSNKFFVLPVLEIPNA